MELSVTEEGFDMEVASSPNIPQEFRMPLIHAIGAHLGKMVPRPNMADHKVTELRRTVDRVFVRGVGLRPSHSKGRLVLQEG